MSEAGRHTVTFDRDASGERLDRALAAALPFLTRSRVKALIEGRRVTSADGSTLEEPSRKVKTGERYIVDIPEPEPAEPLPQEIGLEILYEDDEVVVFRNRLKWVPTMLLSVPKRHMTQAELWRDRLCFVCAKDHPLAQRSRTQATLSLAELCEVMEIHPMTLLRPLRFHGPCWKSGLRRRR